MEEEEEVEEGEVAEKAEKEDAWAEMEIQKMRNTLRDEDRDKTVTA